MLKKQLERKLHCTQQALEMEQILTQQLLQDVRGAYQKGVFHGILYTGLALLGFGLAIIIF